MTIRGGVSLMCVNPGRERDQCERSPMLGSTVCRHGEDMPENRDWQWKRDPAIFDIVPP